MEAGEAEAAIRTLRDLVRDHPEDVTARLNLGTALLQRPTSTAAASVFTDLLSRDPSNALAQYNLGMALKQQDRFDEAERALRRAIDLYRRLPTPRLRWESCCGRRAGSMKRSRHSGRPSAGRRNTRLCRYMLATVLRQQGALNEAITHLQRTVELQPALGESVRQPRTGPAAAGSCR